MSYQNLNQRISILVIRAANHCNTIIDRFTQY